MTFDHVYLSPHLDDVALSCGGTVAARSARGERVLVVTICAGEPPAGIPLPPFIEEAYRKVGVVASEVVRLRRREEQRAMDILGAELELLDELDAIYRLPERYHSAETIFGDVADADPLVPVAAAIIGRVAPETVLHAPLGIGGHVDHRILHRAAADSPRRVEFYEDFPYVANSKDALALRLSEIAERLEPVLTDVSSTLSFRVRAIQAYLSQVGLLGGDLASKARAYSARIGNGVPSERTWVRASVTRVVA